ncbi:flagellar protein [Paenibacillus koleovorans]|uniref:flagellar protein n=1 Tax=Paenibacillus koleovorans TaxID=121608 RepID=UPI000FD75B1F|nr:flagellar protein [Paenibacillus koleovorans]
MAMNLDNCPQCGKLYVKNSYNACPACLRAVEDQYQACVQFLRRNRTSSIYELSEATGVSVRQITKFIREGRITNREAPNVQTPCEVCNGPVKDGHICDTCRMKLSRDVNHLKEDVKRRDEERQKLGNTFQIKDRGDDKKRL